MDPFVQTMVCIRGPICTPNTNHGLAIGRAAQCTRRAIGRATQCTAASRAHRSNPLQPCWYVREPRPEHLEACEKTTAPVLWHHAAMLDKLSLTHGCVHRTERVQQQPSATIIRCVQWMQRSRNHSQSLWRPACRPHSTHNHKPWVQFCTHACFSNHGFVTGVQIGSLCTNHGLYTGCNFAPTTVLQTMVCIRGPICTPY